MIRALVFVLVIASLGVPMADASQPHQDPGASLHHTVQDAASLVHKRRELQQVLSQLSRHLQRLRQVRLQEHRVLDELEGIDRTREEAERRLAEVSVELHRSQSQAKITTAKLAVAQRALSAHRTQLQARLRDIYKYGRTGTVEVLLGAGDFGELVTRWRYLATIMHFDSRLVARYQGEARRYHELRAALLHEQDRFISIAARTETRRRELLAQEQVKRAILRRLQQERVAYERAVRELEQNSRDLEVLIRRMQTARGRSRVAQARGLGGFLWPARGVFMSGFGLRRLRFGIRRMHTGIDIAAVWGAPVAAAADGRVIYAERFGGYGKIVILDHEAGVSTLYAHLSQILVPTGASVRRGQLIGRVGSTGYSTGPHLHFEIRINGRPIDPMRR